MSCLCSLPPLERISDQGSLFNHSEHPNVSYSIDTSRDCIVYTSTRTIDPDEELCIFYGHTLWFNSVDVTSVVVGSAQELDEWGGLASIQASLPEQGSCSDGDTVDEDSLPFTWKKLSLDKEEEQLNDIELGMFVIQILDYFDRSLHHSTGMGRRYT